MSRLPDDFHQDRALRDAARDVLMADVEHAKATLSGKAIAGRVAGRMGDGAKDVLEVAKVHATDRQGLIAGLMAIIALWFAREPLAEIMGSGSANDDEDAPQDVDSEHAAETDLDADISEADSASEEGTAETPPPKTHRDLEGKADLETADLEPLSTGETA